MGNVLGGGVVEAARARVRCSWVKFKKLPFILSPWCIISYKLQDYIDHGTETRAMKLRICIVWREQSVRR